MFRIRDIALIAAALAAAFLPLPEAAVERLYSGVYAGLQPRLTSLSNLAPFALLDVLIAHGRGRVDRAGGT